MNRSKHRTLRKKNIGKKIHKIIQEKLGDKKQNNKVFTNKYKSKEWNIEISYKMKEYLARFNLI